MIAKPKKRFILICLSIFLLIILGGCQPDVGVLEESVDSCPWLSRFDGFTDPLGFGTVMAIEGYTMTLVWEFVPTEETVEFLSEDEIIGTQLGNEMIDPQLRDEKTSPRFDDKKKGSKFKIQRPTPQFVNKKLEAQFIFVPDYTKVYKKQEASDSYNRPPGKKPDAAFQNEESSSNNDKDNLIESSFDEIKIGQRLEIHYLFRPGTDHPFKEDSYYIHEIIIMADYFARPDFEHDADDVPFSMSYEPSFYK